MIVAPKKRVNRHLLVDGDVQLDPPKYNRGQPIHLEGENVSLKPIDTRVLADSGLYISDVEKKRVKNVINVDWFETTIMLQIVLVLAEDQIDFQVSDSLVLVNAFRPTKMYKCLWKVIFMGEEVGTLLTNPKTTKLKANQAQFKMSNHLLYARDWLDTYKEILNSSKWIHNNMTRFDIAIDGLAAKKAKRLAYRQLKNRGNGVVQRKGKVLFHTGSDAKNRIKKFFVGSAKSDKLATIYPKSTEIEHSGKEYIVNSWKHNNLDMKSDEVVNRFELRLRRRVMDSKKNNYDWRRLDQPDYVASIVMTECKNWFEFYSKSKDTNVHRKYKTNTMEWIDWKSISGELLPKNKAVVKSGSHRAKRLIKDMLFVEAVDGRKIDRTLIHDLIEEYVLHKWFDDRIDYWRLEFSRQKKYRNINSN